MALRNTGPGRLFGPATGTQMINHAGGATEAYATPNAVYSRPAIPGPPPGSTAAHHGDDDQGPHVIPPPGKAATTPGPPGSGRGDKERRGGHSSTGVPEGQGRAFYTGFGRGTGR